MVGQAAGTGPVLPAGVSPTSYPASYQRLLQMKSACHVI